MGIHAKMNMFTKIIIWQLFILQQSALHDSRNISLCMHKQLSLLDTSVVTYKPKPNHELGNLIALMFCIAVVGYPLLTTKS